MIMSCMGCTDRVVGCHSTCKKYQEEYAAHKEESERIRKQRDATADINNFKVRSVVATKKRYGRK